MVRKLLITFAFMTVIFCLFAGCVENSKQEIAKECIEATITGIKIDIQRLEGYLNLDDLEKRNEIEETLQKLKEDLEYFQSISPSSYIPPEPIEVKGSIEEQYTTDTIISLIDQKKSGPFYHIVKVHKDKGKDIIPKNEYSFVIYKVYKRYYPFEAWYVFVKEFK